jgi:hypothetical protein
MRRRHLSIVLLKLMLLQLWLGPLLRRCIRFVTARQAALVLNMAGVFHGAGPQPTTS